MLATRDDARELSDRLKASMDERPTLPQCGCCTRKNPRWTIDRIGGHSWSDGMRLEVCGYCRNYLIRQGYWEDRSDPDRTARLRALGRPGELTKKKQATKKEKTDRLKAGRVAYLRMMQETRPTTAELMALGLMFHLHPDWL